MSELTRLAAIQRMPETAASRSSSESVLGLSGVSLKPLPERTPRGHPDLRARKETEARAVHLEDDDERSHPGQPGAL
jgi:hypothetical protein